MRTERVRGCVTYPAALFAALMLFAAPASAQTPSAEQLKMIQSLPPAQREAMLQQLDLGVSSANSFGGSGGTATSNQIVVQQPAGAKAEAQDAVERDVVAAQGREPRIKGGEQILVELASARGSATARQPTAGLAVGQSPEEDQLLDDLRKRVISHNPYELSAGGVLQLPGIPPIQLGGLTQKEAQERLSLDPVLRQFSVAVTVLRIDPQGAKALKPYGYEIFRNAANALVPGTDIPVPEDYKLGPGDTMTVQLFGQQSQTYVLPVGRDGTIGFPELGPISVGGMGFGAARSMLESRVKRQMIGTQARVSLSDLRTTRVFVLGDAERPGSVVISSLATATAALFASGGVKQIGSLRTIEIRRGGGLIRKLDLYDVLLRGNTENDLKLQTGDVVFVPPVGPTVGVDGAVRRPAIYEVGKERTVSEIVALAGGLDAAADLSSVTLERIDEGRDRRMLRVDLATDEGRATQVRDGDIIRVGTIPPVVDNGIIVAGHLYRPGTVAYRPGMRLSAVIGSADALKPGADLHYVLVRREAQDRGKIFVFSADLAAALAQPGSAVDIPLKPRDRIDVFDRTSPRDHVVGPLLEELNGQARPSDPMAVVEITGRVNAPGKYPLEGGMRVSDLLRAGGGLQDAAYSQTAELTRYDVKDGQHRTSEVRAVDIAAIGRGDPSADLELRPYDVIAIQQTPDWGRVENISIRGEVRFPGVYRIRRGETLGSVVERAGGLTALAFPEGAVFTREELKQRERQQLDRLADRMQADIGALSLQASQTNPGAVESITAGRSLLEQLRTTKPVGRLVIDLRKVVSERDGIDAQILLRNGDELIIPRRTQEVTVLGEVQNSTSLVYRPGMRREDVIELSGGMTARADRARVYVVRADGRVVSQPSHWFGSRSTEVYPGDTVVVPIDAERMRPLPLWTAVTTIIYNLAIAATAIARL